MNSFRVQLTINAPPEVVWSALADIGHIDAWNPGVQASRVTSDEATGVGARRHCELSERNYLHEEVVAWEPRERLTMRITETNLPFKTADIQFSLEPQGRRTLVTVAPEYELKFGMVGKLMDRFYVQGAYEKGMRALLRGLKQFVEEQETAPASLQEPVASPVRKR